MTVCEMIKYCDDSPCALITNSTSDKFVKTKYPQLIVQDQ